MKKTFLCETCAGKTILVMGARTTPEIFMNRIPESGICRICGGTMWPIEEE